MTRLFPLWAIGLSVVAYVFPHRFTNLAPAIPILLGVVMLGMGLTLTASSFRSVLERPRVVFTGVCLQFLVMPLAALPGAVFSIWHNLTGSVLASRWSIRDSRSRPAEKDRSRLPSG